MGRLLAAFKAVWRFLEWLSDQLGWISGALIVIMMIIVMRELVGRYFFNFPSDWVLELSCYLLVGVVYLAAAHTEVTEGHIGIDFVYARFRGKTKNVVDIFIYAVGFCWSAVLVWQGGRLAWKSLVTGARSAEIMRMPLFPSQVMVPIGAFLLCLIFIGKILNKVGLLTRGGK